MNVAGYVRVSTEQQREEGSHENQRDRLETWADRHDHELTIFEDIAISGQADDRPEYDAMMDSLDDFDAVAVRELSRFGRSLQRVLRDIERLQAEDVEFISVTEDFATDSAMGKAMLQARERNGRTAAGARRADRPPTEGRRRDDGPDPRVARERAVLQRDRDARRGHHRRADRPVDDLSVLSGRNLSFGLYDRVDHVTSTQL
jgi:DNA invertase Pin-like site-specific DNA recombinase